MLAAYLPNPRKNGLVACRQSAAGLSIHEATHHNFDLGRLKWEAECSGAYYLVSSWNEAYRIDPDAVGSVVGMMEATWWIENRSAAPMTMVIDVGFKPSRDD